MFPEFDPTLPVEVTFPVNVSVPEVEVTVAPERTKVWPVTVRVLAAAERVPAVEVAVPFTVTLPPRVWVNPEELISKLLKVTVGKVWLD